jgi:formylglycine-generating enzyme
LNYRYWWVDFKGAASKSGKDEEYGEVNSLNQLHSVRGHSDRSQFVIEEIINVYPDTLVWVHDFTYSYGEPLTETYFWHPAYDDYPVVGVTWGQSKAFNAWRTQILNEWKQQNGESFVQRFRMPSEAEWEYAARGGLELSPYPWGGPYIRNIQGCPLANFKPMRGDYVEDAGCYTVPIESYSPNDYGLYQMAGNVSEWTNTAYDESVYDFTHDMSSEYTYNAEVDDPPSLKRKVIRGGSWKDIGYYCQTGSRSYEYQDTAKSYIGFRCVMSYLGRGKNVAPEDFNAN